MLGRAPSSEGVLTPGNGRIVANDKRRGTLRLSIRSAFRERSELRSIFFLEYDAVLVNFADLERVRTESADATARASQCGERNTHVAEETKLGVREGGDAVDLVLASKRAEPQSVLALLATRHGGGSLQHFYLVCCEDVSSILTGRACPKALLAAMGPGED